MGPGSRGLAIAAMAAAAAAVFSSTALSQPPPAAPPAAPRPVASTGGGQEASEATSGDLSPEQMKARADKKLMRWRGLAMVSFGFGGEADLEAVLPDPPGSLKVKDDLLVSYGLDSAFEFPVHRHIGLGAFARYWAWVGRTADDAGIARNHLLGVGPMGTLRYPFLGEYPAHGEVYLRFPIGLAVSVLADVPGPCAAWFGNAACRGYSGVGLVAGVMAGVQYFFGSYGLVAEVGWLYHSFSNLMDVQTAGFAFRAVDLEIRLSQLAANVGVAAF